MLYDHRHSAKEVCRYIWWLLSNLQSLCRESFASLSNNAIAPALRELTAEKGVSQKAKAIK